MPVGAAIGGGAAISAISADRAADKAAKASNKASKRAAQTQQNAISEQRRQFDLVRGDTQPYRDTGRGALNQLASLFNLGRPQSSRPSNIFESVNRGLAGSKNPQNSFRIGRVPITNSPGATDVSGSNVAEAVLRASPGYNFRLGESEKALERAQAARGYSLAPRAFKEVGRYASDYASGEFGNLVESLFRLSGLGGSAVNTSASAGANAASGIGSAYGNIGNAYLNAGNQAANSALISGQGVNNAIQGGLQNYSTYQLLNQYNRNQPTVTVGGG